MSCYYPFLAVRSEEKTAKGKNKVKILGHYDGINNLEEAKKYNAASFVVPCGKCIGCRLDKSREWADRMLLELDHSKKGVFITLTLNDDALRDHVRREYPDGSVTATVKKEDISEFMKVLRSRKHFESKNIRFFACGEYGSQKGRPHYHAILFGVSKEDFNPQFYGETLSDNKTILNPIYCIGKNEFNQLYYRSDLLEDIWQKGMCCLSEVSWQTCAYVSRYVTKKLTGDESWIYDELDIEKEFCLMSRRPGIAGYYYQEHEFDPEVTKLWFSDQNGSKSVSVPKYIIKKLEDFNPVLYDQIKLQRRLFTSDREFLKMQNTDLSFQEQSQLECNVKLKSAQFLNRVFEESAELS